MCWKTIAIHLRKNLTKYSDVGQLAGTVGLEIHVVSTAFGLKMLFQRAQNV